MRPLSWHHISSSSYSLDLIPEKSGHNVKCKEQQIAVVCTHRFNRDLSEYSTKSRHYTLFPILALILVHYSPDSSNLLPLWAAGMKLLSLLRMPLWTEPWYNHLFPVASLKTAALDIPQLPQPLVVQVPTCLKHIAGLKIKISWHIFDWREP